jgi:hypothetical protein
VAEDVAPSRVAPSFEEGADSSNTKGKAEAAYAKVKPEARDDSGNAELGAGGPGLARRVELLSAEPSGRSSPYSCFVAGALAPESFAAAIRSRIPLTMALSAQPGFSLEERTSNV